MSTHWGYVCRSHDPEIESDHWINRGDDLLAAVYQRVRAGDWPNDPRITAWEEPAGVPGFSDSCDNSPILWLRAHPNCDVALRNEYGDTKELEESS